MAIVWIPSLMQKLTGGRGEIEVEGRTVREIIDNLDALHPGIKERLVSGDRIRPGLAVAVNAEVSEEGLRQVVSPSSEVHFVAAVSGG